MLHGDHTDHMRKNKSYLIVEWKIHFQWGSAVQAENVSLIYYRVWVSWITFHNTIVDFSRNWRCFVTSTCFIKSLFYFFFACSRHGLALSLDSILGSQILFNQIFWFSLNSQLIIITCKLTKLAWDFPIDRLKIPCSVFISIQWIAQ